jgi:hypothetical protein
MNGMKLSRNLFACQLFAQYLSRSGEAIVLLGPTFDGSRFEAAGTIRQHA